jgi:hypothetical protein
MADTPADQSHLHHLGNPHRSQAGVDHAIVESATEKEDPLAVSLDVPSLAEESHSGKAAAAYIILSALLTFIAIVIGLIIVLVKAIT